MGVQATGLEKKVGVFKPKPVEAKPDTNNIETKSANLNNPTVTTKTNANDLAFQGDVIKTQLNYQLDNNGTNQVYLPYVAKNSNQTQSPNPLKVDGAVERIQRSLTQKWNDWDVTKGDLNNIRNEFRNLNDAEANAVFDELSENDLNRWTSELNGLNGGYNTEEKKQLFDELAGQLDAGNAARFLNALDGQEDKQAFSNSYAQNASDSEITSLIRGTAPNAPNNENSAIIVAELISGLEGNPQALERALGNMTQSQIDAVVKEATQRELHTNPYSGTVSVTNDPEPLANLLEAVATSNNPEIKARFFESAANELSTIENSGNLLAPTFGKREDAAEIRDALTKLLQSDTTGIMRELETNFRNGKGITAYAKSMLNAGENEELGNIIARLSKGNDLTGNPLDRFGTRVNGTDGNPHYNNAQVLGYFAGALFSGAKQITGDRAKQADMFKNVFGTIAGAAGTANIPAGIASSVLNGLTSEIVNSVTDSLNKGTMDLEEALESLLFPRNTNTGELYEGAAEADFDSAFSRVVLRNS